MSCKFEKPVANYVRVSAKNWLRYLASYIVYIRIYETFSFTYFIDKVGPTM